MKIKPLPRLAISLVSILVVSCVMIFVERVSAFVVADPIVQLADAPRRMGDWIATEAELTDAEFGVLNASDVASLRLTDPLGRRAFMHVATWADPDEVAETCPHHPGVCYAGNGWFPAETKLIQLDVEQMGLVPVEISVMERNDQKIVIAYTYTMGKESFATDSAARLAQAKLWGSHQWPPVTKYLIQVDAQTIDDAEPVVDELLGGFLNWFHLEREQGLTKNAAA
ncbi:MAG: exosortase-associated EpsI family protein [Rubripirellula sp.]